MCKGFGMIITKTLEGFFCEPDGDGNCSHSEVLRKLGWEDNENQFLRNFVRVQCPNWTIESFEFDEEDTLPGWAEENRDQIINLVNNTLEKVFPIQKEFYDGYCPQKNNYIKIKNLAEKEYEKTIRLAHNKYYDATKKAYEKVPLEINLETHIVGLKKYEADCLILEEVYKNTIDEAGRKYTEDCYQTRNEYTEAFNKAKNQMLEKIKTVKGYIEYSD